METAKLKKYGIWMRVIFLILTVLATLIIPKRGSSGLIDPENLYGPFMGLSTFQRMILSNCRLWFVNQIILFASLLVALEFVCAGFNIKKNRTYKIIASALFVLCFAPLIYFSIGSVLWLGPFPPMSFPVWLAIFGVQSNWTYVWWGVSAVLFQLACKL